MKNQIELRIEERTGKLYPPFFGEGLAAISQQERMFYMDKIMQIHDLVAKLNRYRHEYYNLAAPSVSDAQYDLLFDLLPSLEKETGCIMANSPTQTVGYQVVDGLEKVSHPVPLLSLYREPPGDAHVQIRWPDREAGI